MFIESSAASMSAIAKGGRERDPWVPDGVVQW